MSRRYIVRVSRVEYNALSPSNVNYSSNMGHCLKQMFLLLMCLQMESLISRMQAEHTGVQVRTVKSFMTKIPSVFTGNTIYITPINTTSNI